MTKEELAVMYGKLSTVRTVAVFLGSRDVDDPTFNSAAAELGAFLAKNGLTLIYGGAGTGSMKALAEAARTNGGNVTGVFPANLSRKILFPDLTELIEVPDISERKKIMQEKADCVVVLPGGIGTLDEFFSALEEIKRQRKPIGLLNVNRYFDALKTFLDHANHTGFISDSQRKAVAIEKQIEALFYQMLGNVRIIK